MPATRLPHRVLTLLAFWSATGGLLVAGVYAADGLETELDRLEAAVPTDVAGYRAESSESLGERTAAVDEAAAAVARQVSSGDLVNAIDRLFAAHGRVTRLGDVCLELRAQFAGSEVGPLARDSAPTDEVEAARQVVRRYLRTNDRLIDLAARLRYSLVDALEQAWQRAGGERGARDRLLERARHHASDVGALVLSRQVLGAAARGESVPGGQLLAACELAAETGQVDSLPALAALARRPRIAPSTLLRLAQTIRRLGLPQDADPEAPAELPRPAITATELETLLGRIDERRLATAEQDARRELLAWLAARRESGWAEATFRWGKFELAPGDWLLMRNPSPFNLFTDLAPGLFTHVGVLAAAELPGGRRRLVVVDLPERGATMPATSFELFVQRTLHFVVLRHRDPAVQAPLAEAAVAVIGNEIEFDLNFRTERLAELQGQSLADAKIKTYCAGLLLLCGQTTGRPRSEFFPIPEYPAGGRALENVAQLGMSVGKDFVSPTGALFSPQLELVARREPMYDPTREIEEAVYNHFSDRVQTTRLDPNPSWTQSLTQKLAEASRWNSLLARALASAAGVSAETDLLAAAKTAAVIETLDEIAQEASRKFTAARDALRTSDQVLASRRLNRSEWSAIRRLRQTHAGLHRQWISRQLSPRELRRRLVAYYIASGRQALDERFFSLAAGQVLGQDR